MHGESRPASQPRDDHVPVTGCDRMKHSPPAHCDSATPAPQKASLTGGLRR
jgi:hypothetical protein